MCCRARSTRGRAPRARQVLRPDPPVGGRSPAAARYAAGSSMSVRSTRRWWAGRSASRPPSKMKSAASRWCASVGSVWPQPGPGGGVALVGLGHAHATLQMLVLGHRILFPAARESPPATARHDLRGCDLAARGSRVPFRLTLTTGVEATSWASDRAHQPRSPTPADPVNPHQDRRKVTTERDAEPLPWTSRLPGGVRTRGRASWAVRRDLACRYPGHMGSPDVVMRCADPWVSPVLAPSGPARGNADSLLLWWRVAQPAHRRQKRQFFRRDCGGACTGVPSPTRSGSSEDVSPSASAASLNSTSRTPRPSWGS